MSHSVSAIPRLGLSLRRQPSLILQSESAECGLACIAMICHFHGLKADLPAMRLRFAGYCQRGVTLKQLMSIATQVNLHSRAVKLELDNLKDLSCPCILHWDMDHFVVLLKANSKHLTILDPALGKRRISLEQAGNHFTGVALELSPNKGFVKEKAQSPLGFSHFWQHVSGLKRSLGILLVLSLILQVCAIASPYYMQLVIDDVISRDDAPLLDVLVVGFGLLLVVELLTTLCRKVAILRLSSTLAQQLSINVFHHLLKLPYDYFSKRHIGDVISRFQSLNNLRDFLTDGIVTVFIDVLMAIVTLTVMFIYNTTLAWFAVLITCMYVVLRLCFLGPLQRLHCERLAMAAKESTHFMESVKGIQFIKLFQLHNVRQSQWQNLLTQTLNKDIRISQCEMLFSCLHLFIFGLENLIVVYLAAQTVMSGALTVGMLYAFISYKNRFSQSVESLLNNLINWRMLRVHFDRLADIVFTPTKPESQSGPQIMPCKECPAVEIELTNLTYGYGPDTLIFSDVSLQANAGELILITGASGSGKTTLLKCIAGLLHPTAGKVAFYQPTENGQNILLPGSFAMGVVMQDDHFLSGSLAENICAFSDTPNLSLIAQCAMLACLHDWIMQLPMQYQTRLGDLGSTLSGGQLQRLFIARALYQQPALLLMDEGSSQLDIFSEKAINTNLAALKITRIFIAHRPQTIAMADRRYHLQGGKLSEVPVNHQLTLTQSHQTQGENYV